MATDRFPSFLRIDGVIFPLTADPVLSGHLNYADTPGLDALDLVVTGIIHAPERAEYLEKLRAGESVSLPHRAASRVNDDNLRDLADGPMSWKRMSGALPNLERAHLVQAAGIDDMLVVPTDTLVALIETLGALCDDVSAGRREPKVDPDMPVPSWPPPSDDVLANDRERAFAREALLRRR